MPKKTLISFITTLLFGVAFIIFGTYQPDRPDLPIASTPEPSPSQILGITTLRGDLVPVTKVIDGDTLEVEVNGEKKTVRLIGINTPETVDPRRAIQCFGKEASNETKRLSLGRMVALKKDISETDKYGRLLRFVYIQLDDGNRLFLNDYLVRAGFAQVSTYPPDTKFVSQFKEAEAEARAAKKGLWSSCYY